MNWIQDNKFLAGWLAITILGVLGLGLLLVKARGSYNTAYGEFDTNRQKVFALEGKKLYPNKENVEAKAAVVTGYRDAVSDLHGSLASFQRDLRPVEQVALQAKLKERIKQLSQDAVRAKTTLPEGFAFGMSKYVNTLPPAAACPLLDYQLDALTDVASTLVRHRVAGIESFDRDPVPGESDYKKAKDQPKKGEDAKEPVIVRYPVKIVFKTGAEGLREVVNEISNPKPGGPYHVLRLLRISNEQQLGPPKIDRAPAPFVDPGNGGFIDPVPPAPEPAPAVDADAAAAAGADPADPAAGTVPPDGGDPAAAPDAAGVIDPAAEDAAISFGDGTGDIEFGTGSPETETIDAEFILGQEKVDVFMKIELLRFSKPKKDDAEEKDPAAK